MRNYFQTVHQSPDVSISPKHTKPKVNTNNNQVYQSYEKRRYKSIEGSQRRSPKRRVNISYPNRVHESINPSRNLPKLKGTFTHNLNKKKSQMNNSIDQLPTIITNYYTSVG